MGKLADVEVPLISTLDLRPTTVLADERVMRSIDRIWNWPEPPKIGVHVERMSTKMANRSVMFRIKLDTSEFDRGMRRMERGVRRVVREQRVLRRQARRQRMMQSWYRLRYMWHRNHEEIAMYAVVGIVCALAMLALIYLISNGQ
jgi:hypothetical protein